MNKSFRYLTKSAFKTAQECPTKLSYLKKPEFLSTKQDNAFLKALADGGFQIGELAKIYLPDGVQISTLNHEEALNQTDKLLELPVVTLFEAAFRFENCFIRADILIKNGNLIDLIEVKSKSYEGTGNNLFWTKNQDKLRSDWEPYLIDVAFQKWVLTQTKPNFVITPHLMLADKTKLAKTDGINQRFFIISGPTDSNVKVRVAPGTDQEAIGESILTKLNVEREVDFLLEQKYNEMNFESYVRFLADHYSKDIRIPPKLSRECRMCEFRIPAKKAEEFQSGFDQCWKESGISPTDLKRPLILDIWKLHYTKKDALLENKRYFMDQISPEDIKPKTKPKKKDEKASQGLTQFERQCVQIEFAKRKSSEPYLDSDGLSNALKLQYPLHFIDFETTMAAIPFYKGRRPYEQIAFQFSHHAVHEDGKIEHKDQYLCFEKGKFPNYDFVRALKKSLENDQGTIFRYADHENNVLRQIHTQLSSDPTPPEDAKDLCQWIDTISREKIESDEYRIGPRCMVDLKLLVQEYYYHPATQGSNSIKFVLPAILQTSEYLQKKYSQPIYGSKTGTASLNFKNHVWIKLDSEGCIQDPYKALQPIFSDIELPEETIYSEDDRIAEGGAAMTAFGRMQFTEMSNSERESIAAALLRYCELDTFAMVMIYEYWKHEIELKQKKVA